MGGASMKWAENVDGGGEKGVASMEMAENVDGGGGWRDRGGKGVGRRRERSGETEEGGGERECGGSGEVWERGAESGVWGKMCRGWGAGRGKGERGGGGVEDVGENV